MIGVDFNVGNIAAKVQTEVLRFVYLIVIFLLTSAVIVYFTVRRMIQPIVSLAQVSRKIAEGDLRVDRIVAKSQDEIGLLSESFIGMVDNLKMLVARVSSSAGQVGEASKVLTNSIQHCKEMTKKITEAMQEVVAGSTIQHISTQESAKVMEEMAAGINC